MSATTRATALALLLAGSAASAVAGPGIYTCVDAKGRRLTSDRPIVECLDRQQKELGPTGTVRRTLGPSLTAVERAALEEREKKLAEERQRLAEEKRLQRLLVLRYPNQAAHDAERSRALLGAEDAIASGHARLAELERQRGKLQAETEFYKSPAQWPAALKRQIEEHAQQLAAQQRFIAQQEEEKQRIQARFDEELARLKQLWAQAQGASGHGTAIGLSSR